MKKIMLLSVCTLSTTAIAQIGINTTKPQTTLHIDGGKDNNIYGAPTTEQQGNDFVVTSSGTAAVGTVTPDTSAALELRSTNKGFLPSRVSLQSTTDTTTIPKPATGLIVYNTNTLIKKGTGTGLYFNSGTATAPNWASLSFTNSSSGSTTAKIVYQGSSGIAANSVKLGEFEFTISSGNVPQFRLSSKPSANVIVDWNLLEAYSPSHQDFYTKNTTFTTSNYNTYQSLSFTKTDAMTNIGEVNIMYITIRGEATPPAYRITFFAQGSVTPYTWVIWAEKI